MTAITESTRVVRNDGIPSGEVGGEMVALDLERGNCFGMDRIGTAVWQLTARPVSPAEIADSLIRTYAVDREQCLAEILPFLDELLAEGLLRKVDG